MMILSATNPQWADPAGQSINLDVQFDTLPAPVAFTAAASDTELHGVELFNSAKAGVYGAVAAYTSSSAAAQAQAATCAIAKAELTQIDAHSVRSMREFFLAKFPNDPLLPPELATHNAAALTQRAKIK